MRPSIETSVSRMLRTVAACAALAAAGAAAHAAEAGFNPGEPYEWSAEFVSWDAATETAVFRSRVVSHAAIDGLAEFRAGDPLILTWSGRMWASGIRNLERMPELTPASLSLPVEFVAAEDDGRYISFRVPVPEDSVELISTMQPGVLVTGVSPRMATSSANAVSSLRPYNDVS